MVAAGLKGWGRREDGRTHSTDKPSLSRYAARFASAQLRSVETILTHRLIVGACMRNPPVLLKEKHPAWWLSTRKTASPTSSYIADIRAMHGGRCARGYVSRSQFASTSCMWFREEMREIQCKYCMDSLCAPR
jgi:hypothetical protein